MVQEAQMKTRTVTPASVTLPLDKFPHIEFSVTVAAVTPHKCMMCGTTELGPRAKTCSTNCRKAMSRRKEYLQRELQHVRDALQVIQRYSRQWPDLQAEIEKTLNDCVTSATVTYFGVTGSGEG